MEFLMALVILNKPQDIDEINKAGIEALLFPTGSGMRERRNTLNQ